MSDRGAALRRRGVRRHVIQPTSAPRREDEALDDAGTQAIASYIADMTGQLELMATSSGLELVAYFLAMARAEGEAAARGDVGAAREAPKSA